MKRAVFILNFVVILGSLASCGGRAGVEQVPPHVPVVETQGEVTEEGIAEIEAEANARVEADIYFLGRTLFTNNLDIMDVAFRSVHALLNGEINHEQTLSLLATSSEILHFDFAINEIFAERTTFFQEVLDNLTRNVSFANRLNVDLTEANPTQMRDDIMSFSATFADLSANMRTHYEFD